MQSHRVQKPTPLASYPGPFSDFQNGPGYKATAPPDHTSPRLPKVIKCLQQIPPYSGPTAVVRYTVLATFEQPPSVYLIIAFLCQSVALAILLLKKTQLNEAEYIIATFKNKKKTSSERTLFFVFKEISKRFKRKLPRRRQPLYKGQLAHPQCVLCSEVLLYSHLCYRNYSNRMVEN